MTDFSNVDPEQQGSGVVREAPDVEVSRSARVKQQAKMIEQARSFYNKGAFKRMKRDQNFAWGRQLTMTRTDDTSTTYKANMIQRHIHHKVGNLYAKNPRAMAKRKERLEFTMWDGDLNSIMQAQQNVVMAGQGGLQPSEQDIGLLQDYQQGVLRRQQFDKVSDTLVILFHYFMSEQEPGFKMQMKQLVRRTVTNSLGWLKLGFQREMGHSEEIERKISDYTDRIENVNMLLADAKDDEITDGEAKLEELRQTIDQFRNEPDLILREGLVFTFPRTTRIIVDPGTRILKGLINTWWIAEEHIFTPDEIKAKFQVDIGAQYTAYNRNDDSRIGLASRYVGSGRGTVTGFADKAYALVWELYDKRTGQVYWIVDGYPDYLKEPEAPNINLERFFPYFPLVFNELEHEEELIPPSDVELLMPMQLEYNRQREGLREHRKANRPKYITPSGTLEDDDKDILASHPANAIIELSGLQPGQDVDTVLKAFKSAPIDPNLYESRGIFDDMQRVVGTQEADIGGTSGDTAFEVSVARAGKMSTESSAVDDLDEFLGEVARSSGQVLFEEMSEDKVFEIVGPGAVWPTLSRLEVAKQVFLDIKAGSSGRPNKEQEAATFERMAPFLLQVPGVSPKWIADVMFDLLDSSIDITDAFIDGLPSIIAQNSQKNLQLSENPEERGNPSRDPQNQGQAGGQNQVPERDTAGGPQPSRTGDVTALLAP